jgi:hypothetical protein
MSTGTYRSQGGVYRTGVRAPARPDVTARTRPGLLVRRWCSGTCVAAPRAGAGPSTGYAARRRPQRRPTRAERTRPRRAPSGHAPALPPGSPPGPPPAARRRWHGRARTRGPDRPGAARAAARARVPRDPGGLRPGDDAAGRAGGDGGRPVGGAGGSGDRGRPVRRPGAALARGAPRCGPGRARRDARGLAACGDGDVRGRGRGPARADRPARRRAAQLGGARRGAGGGGRPRRGRCGGRDRVRRAQPLLPHVPALGRARRRDLPGPDAAAAGRAGGSAQPRSTGISPGRPR